MKNTLAFLLISTVALGACSSSNPIKKGALSIGSTDPGASANGLPYAVPDSVLADLESAGEIKVKVVRALTDYDSGVTRLVISDETLTMAELDIADDLDNIIITLGGETITFVAGSAPASSGQDDWSAYINSDGAVSGTGAIYSYEYGSNADLTGEFDSEAFFVFGYETDPDEIAALVDESVSYSGEASGYGQAFSPDTGDVIESEVSWNTDVVIVADFAASEITGTLENGEVNVGIEPILFTAEFLADIEGNGYTAPLTSVLCDITCTSNSSIGGAFFGTDGLETSGIIGLDVLIDDGEAPAVQFVSGGSYTATKPVE